VEKYPACHSAWQAVGRHTRENSSSVDVWHALDFDLLVVVARRGLAMLGYVQDVADEVVVVVGM
jgi:hypothetical protein